MTVAMPDEFFFGFLISAMIPYIILAIVFGMTGKVTFTFLRAKLKGSPIIINLRKDKVLEFLTGKYQDGSIETKKKGIFLTIPDAMYRSPVGTPAGIAFEEYGTVLTPEFIAATEELNSKGFKSLKDVDMAVDMLNRESKDLIDKIEGIDNELFILQQDSKQNKVLIEKYKETKAELEKRLEEAIEHRKVETKRILPIHAIQTVKNFFIYNINPMMIKARIERKAAELASEMKKGFDIKWIFGIVLLFIGAALAYAIVQSQSGQASQANYLAQIANQIAQNNAVQPTTPIANTSAVIR